MCDRDDRELQAFIVLMLEARRALIEQCKKLEKVILDYVNDDEVCRRFMTVPGTADGPGLQDLR
jgi:transposase